MSHEYKGLSFSYSFKEFHDLIPQLTTVDQFDPVLPVLYYPFDSEQCVIVCMNREGDYCRILMAYNNSNVHNHGTTRLLDVINEFHASNPNSLYAILDVAKEEFIFDFYSLTPRVNFSAYPPRDKVTSCLVMNESTKKVYTFYAGRGLHIASFIKQNAIPLFKADEKVSTVGKEFTIELFEEFYNLPEMGGDLIADNIEDIAVGKLDYMRYSDETYNRLKNFVKRKLKSEGGTADNVTITIPNEKIFLTEICGNNIPHEINYQEVDFDIPLGNISFGYISGGTLFLTGNRNARVEDYQQMLDIDDIVLSYEKGESPNEAVTLFLPKTIE